MKKADFIEAGKIVNTHGIKGEVKIEVWLDSPAFMKKFKRLFIKEKEYRVLSSKIQKDHLITRLEGVDDINAAMTYKNTVVYIAREDAGLKKGEYFLCDIIGFTAEDENGNNIGTLKEIFESPASPIYVIQGDTEHLVPGVPEYILGADFEREVIKVHLIEGM